MDKIQELLNQKRIPFLILALTLLIALMITYSNHFNNGFQFDDYHSIVSNEYIRDLSNIPRFFTDNSTMSTHVGNRSYRPVVATLNAIDYSIGELDPFYFHVSIFISYLVLIIVLFFFLKKLFDLALDHPWNKYFALFGSFYFALHTANAETINYIIARSDSFSTLCVVASLLLFANRNRTGKFLYLLPMIIGIYTKQVGVVAVPLIFIYAFLFEEEISLAEGITLKKRNALFSAFKKTGMAFGIAISIFVINQIILTKGPSGGILKEVQTSRWDYFTTQWYVMAHYIGNFILPVNLSADPDIKVITTIWSIKKMIGLAVVSLLMFLAFRTSIKKKYRPISFGILWFFITLLPTSTFHPLGQISNDHRTFLPYIGLFIAVTWSVSLLIVHYKDQLFNSLINKVLMLGLCFLILFSYAYGTHQRNVVWSSADLLWEDVAKKSPENGRGLMNYGLTLMRRGKYQETLVYFDKAMELLPYYSYLHINMGVLKNAMGFPAEAEEYFKNAIRFQRSNAEGYYYYARFLWTSGRSKEAMKFLEKGIEISPGHVGLRTFYDGVKSGRIQPVDPNAKPMGTRAQNLEANEFLNLSLKLYNQGEYESCLTACRKALEIDPTSSKAYNNMCIAYIRLNQLDEAIAAGEKALELQPNFQLAKNNLRWAKSLKSQSEKK